MKARVRFTSILIMLVLFSAIFIACGGGGDGISGTHILDGDGDGGDQPDQKIHITVLSSIGNNDPIMGALVIVYDEQYDSCPDSSSIPFITDSNGELTISTMKIGKGPKLIYLGVSADGYQNECQASKMTIKGYDQTIYLNPSS